MWVVQYLLLSLEDDIKGKWINKTYLNEISLHEIMVSWIYYNRCTGGKNILNIIDDIVLTINNDTDKLCISELNYSRYAMNMDACFCHFC